ncbi:MAG: hypothetical protein FWG52_05300 [Proteobacteria bacterium]|nr:hypothetical protein [Pseudomonadota bacterium]
MSTKQTTPPEGLQLENPYCKKQWPDSICDDYAVNKVVMATCGADAICTLLLANNNISDEFSDSDDEGLKPFGNHMRYGLLMALRTCISSAVAEAEHLLTKNMKEAQ